MTERPAASSQPMISSDDCGACPLHDAAAPDPIDRRSFLRSALTLGSLAALGLDSRSAFASPVTGVAALDTRAGDRPEEKRYPIPAADGVSIDKDNSVIVARAAGRVYAFSLACPHQNTALRWDEGDHQFRCPKHKSRYRPDGSFIEGRATRDMDRLVVRRDGATLVVDVDRLIQQDENLAAWTAAFIPV